MNKRVTVLQAKRLRRELAFNGKSTGYVCNGIIVEDIAPENYNSKKSIISLPKCDEVIEWLWYKYGISITVNIMTNNWFDKKIYFSGFVALYNSPTILFGSKVFCDIDSCKRSLISKSVSYILNNHIDRIK